MKTYPGELLITGLSDLSLTKEEKNFLTKERIGGVLLFSHNYEAPAQLAELVNEIQECHQKNPLFICVDQEGGPVTRFRKNFTQFPSMASVAKTNSPKLVFEMSSIIAQELKTCGVNVNLAPVCDVLLNRRNKVIGERAFGTDEKTVSLYVSSVVRGLQTHGVVACAKHFPGHGGTMKDSHFDLPLIKKPLDEIRSSEWPPFLKAIKARVGMVMMAHLQVDSIDESLPITLSPKAYSLLRKELRFEKVILTDDMQMEAIKKNHSIEEAAVMAIKAGADMLEYRDFEMTQKACEALHRGLGVEDYQEKVDRIHNLKSSFFIPYKPIYIPEISNVFYQESNKTFLDELLKKLEQSG